MGWRKASVPKKNTPMLMRATVLADQNEIPDNHVLTVRDRVLSTDLQRIVQNNVKTDTVTLDLDGEWDGCTVYVTFNDEDSKSGPWSLEWKGQPLTIPSAIGAIVGPVAVSVVGYGSDGELRLVTEAAPALLNVVRSGYVEIVDDNEENKDILSQMVAAGQAAEDAAEAANTAATSANSAATKANSAASSANTAASSANSAATKANSAAVDAQNAYETLQPYMATIDSCANILHREVGPDTVVTADDSFPCKPVEMVVYGNTVQNLWVNPLEEFNSGVTLTHNPDGTFTLSGTANNQEIWFYVTTYALKPNAQYTLSCSADWDPRVMVRIQENYDGGLDLHDVSSSRNSFTFTTRSNATRTQCVVSMQSNGSTASGTYRVMLNEGSTAKPWCPPGLNSVGQLREDENNLWVNPTDRTTSGVTLKNNDDGSFTVSGTNTAGGAIYMGSTGPFALETGKTYTMSIDGDPDFSAYVNFRDSGNSLISSVSVGSSSDQTSTTFSPPESTTTFQLGISVQAGATVSGTYKVMLNEGSTAKPWVPPEFESCVRVMTAGKNLFPEIQSGIHNGITLSGNSADGYILNGTATKSAFFYTDGEITISRGITLTLSTEGTGSENNVSAFVRSVSDGGNIMSVVSGGAPDTVTLEEDVKVFGIRVQYGTELDNYIIKPQLELGSTATAYEPPTITTTPIDLQGRTLNALPDGTRDELHIDGGGNVVLEKRIGCVDSTNSFGSYEATAPCFGCSDAPYALVDNNKTGVLANGLKVALNGGTREWLNYTGGLASNAGVVRVYVKGAEDDATANDLKNTMESVNALVLYPLAEPQTIDLGTITPPTMAAPNVTAYVADDTPAEMTLDYVRDVNIVHSRLEERVAALELASATS